MQSGFGLSRPPTIGSTTRPVDVGSSLWAQNPAAMGSSCMGCMGDNGDAAVPPNGNGNGNGNGAAGREFQRYLVPIGIGALGFLAVTWLMK
jgi:hypothetical protein